MMAASSARVIHKYCKQMGLKSYRRVGPTVDSPGIDKVSKMRDWATEWEGVYGNSPNLWDEI